MDDLYNWKPDAKQAEASNRYLNAAFDAAPEAPPERSLPGEMASGLKRGLYITAPQMIGGAMKAFSPVDSGAYQAGTDLQDSAKAIAALPEMQRGANSHGMVGDTLVAGAEGIGQMAPVLAGGILNPALGAGIAGTMYGGSTYQDTKERMLQQEGLDDAYAAAHPDDARVRKAKLTGLATGTVQGVSDAAMSYLGGRFLKGVFPALGKQTAQGVVRGIAGPGRETLKRFGKAWGAEILGEGITEAAQDEGQAAIERAAGLKDAPAFGAQALDSAQGGVGMAMLLGPLAGPGHYSMFRDARQVQRALVDPSTDPAVRTAAARVMGNEIAKVDQSAAANFLDHAHDAIGDEQQTGSAPYALNLDDTTLLEPLVRASNPGPSSDDSARQSPVEPITPPGTSLVAREPGGELNHGAGIDNSSLLTLNASPGVAFNSDIPNFASPLAGVPPRQTSLQPIATPEAPPLSLTPHALAGPLGRALARVIPDASLPEARPVAPPVTLRGIAGPVIDADYEPVRPALPAPPSEMDKAHAWAKDEIASGRGLGLMQGYGTSNEQHDANILKRYRSAVGGGQGTVTSEQAPVTNYESPVTGSPSRLTPDASPSAVSPVTRHESPVTASSPRSKRRQLDPTRDDMVVAMAKLGGVDLKQAKEQWGATVGDDAKELNRHAGRAGGTGIAYAFKSGGLPLDRMREALVEHGYLPEGATVNDLADAVHAAARGNHTYSSQGDVETRLDRAEQEWLDRHDLSQALKLTAEDLDEAGIAPEDEQLVVECYHDVADVLVDLFDELNIESYDEVKQLIMEVRHEVRSALTDFTDAQDAGAEGEEVAAEPAGERGEGGGQVGGDQGRETGSSEQGTKYSSPLTPHVSPVTSAESNNNKEDASDSQPRETAQVATTAKPHVIDADKRRKFMERMASKARTERGKENWNKRLEALKEKQSPQHHAIIIEQKTTEEATDDNTRNGGHGPAGVEGSKSGGVSGDGAGQRAGGRVGSGRKADQEGDGHSDVRRGDDRSGSVGSKQAPVHLPDGGGSEGSVQPVTPPVSEPRGISLRGDNPGNYRITAETRLGEGPRSEKIRTNLAAIRLLKQLEAERRYPTRDEQHLLARYVGWGGLKSVFDPKSQAAIDKMARQELENILTKEEYFEARQSVLNAHYTSREIIGAIYSVLNHMGFTGGNVLEPTYGSGNFIGLMPERMAAASKWYGSELDLITAKIGQYLYPDAQLLQSGFQNAEFPYGKFDLVIGNPPFGAERITDTNKRRSEISGFKIHNYVIAKSGMHLRPGGVMAMVVTSRFLDTADPEARDYLAKQLRFLGAIRLPNDAFAKNAGTEVTTDLVFFQKLLPGESPADQYQGWLNIGATMTNTAGEEISLNKWFAARPELMLGEPSMQGTMYGGRWRNDGKGEFTLNARPGQDTAAELEKVIQGEYFEKLRDIFQPTSAKTEAAAVSLQVNREDVGIGGYFQEDGKLYLRQDDDDDGNPSFIELTASTPWTEKQSLGETRLNRIKGMLALREAAYDLINAERFDLPNIELRRKELNELYDEFVKKYGFISDSANASLMADDVKIESGLETNYRKAMTAARAKSLKTSPRPATADKASILKQRVFFPVKEVTSAENVRDGYNVSLSERGRLDLEHIADLTGKSVEQVTSELVDEGLIFRDPESGEWRQEDEYLSGNVKAKLRLVEGREGFEKNVEALKKALPADVKAEEIFVDLGATWIPEEVYKEFADLLGIQSPRVLVSPETGMVRIVSHSSVVTNDMNVLMKNDDYGIAELFNAIANKQAVVAYDPGSEPGTRVVNKERTKALAPIVKRMAATFRDWIMADPLRAAKLTQLYNDTQNTHAPRRYNGEHLKTVGATPAIRLRNSQRNAAWRMIQSPVTLLDHVVGSGKTFTIITGVMERKRLGLSNKPMIVVPNHLVGQWAADFLKLYPGARILAATKKDFEKKNRRRLFARIATGNFDAVIVGHSSFGFIPVEADTQREILMEEISYLERALHQAETADDKRTVRNITERIAKKREKIGNLMNRPADNVITFESMGIDNLVVDESHEFKNLEYSTSMQNITGMGNPKGAKKSFDLYAKIQYLRGKDGAVTFATGTPISNSLVEMYTILRYLNRPGLKARGLDVFDSWAKMYALIEPTIEYTASQKLKERQVMTTFDNLPAMLQLYTEFADVISMKDLKRIYAEQIRQINRETGGNEREEFPVPQVKNGGRYLDVADPTPAQNRYMEYLVARADRLERLGGQNDPKTDNHLWLMNDARKMALDIRLVDSAAPSDPDNKVNRAARNIKRLYDAWHADKGAQLVFCDLSTPAKGADKGAAKFIKSALDVAGLDKDKSTLSLLESLDYSEQWQLLKNRIEAELDRLNESADDSDENDRRREQLDKFLSGISDDDTSQLLTADSGFSVYEDLKKTLVGMDIPENEIAFIHDANTDKQKDELFARVNSGDVRVLIGSSKKMGAGTNAQERLVGLHHMDAPWRPSDVEQREGRIIRQGNKLYERDPENFQVEIPAYSTRQTFDAVMWQILARKAGMLDDFRSGTKRLTEEATDSANYAEFMAESTGNPIFREKFRLEKEIDELESTQRSVAARRMASERIVRGADRMLVDEQRDLDSRKRDLDEINSATSFEVEGKEYADDLTEAYNKALTQYKLDFHEYENRLLPEYISAKNQIEEQGLDRKEKAAALKLLKKPPQPIKPSLARLEKTSRAAAAAVKVSEMLDDLPDRGEVEFSYGGSQVVIAKQPGMRDGEYDFKVSINGHHVWDLAANGLKHMSETKLMALFSTGAVKAQVHALYQRALSSMAQLKASIADAKLTLEKVQFKDGARLDQMRDRYRQVVEEVNNLEKDLAEQREKSGNQYMSGDRGRFGAKFSTARGNVSLSTVATIQKALKGALNRSTIPIRVVQSLSDLPRHIQLDMRMYGIEAIDGVFDPRTNSMYLVADFIPSVERARELLRHEWFHAGVADKELEDLYAYYSRKDMALLEQIADERGFDLSSRSGRMEAAGELAAQLAETNPRNLLLARIVAKIKEWLRALGLNVEFGQAEVARLIRDAIQRVQTGPERMRGVRAMADSAYSSNQVSGMSEHKLNSRYSIANHAAKIDAPGKVVTMTKTAFELSGMQIPQKLKASVGKFLSNPWFGSEGKPVRRMVVNLNIERSHVRNEIISDLFRASEGYTGVEGLNNLLKNASKAELKQFNELIKYGDRNDVARTFTRDELYRGKTHFGKLSRTVVEAYKAFHEVIQATNRVRFEKLSEIALLPYAKEPWYQELLDVLETRMQLDKDLSPTEVGQLGKLLSSTRRRMSDQELFGDNNPTGKPVAKAVGDAYKKFMDQLEATSEPGLVRMAYKNITEYRGELDKLKNEWGHVKGYAPRMRKDGDWHVSVYRVDEDGNRAKVYMKPTITEGQARRHVAEVKGNLEKLLKGNYSSTARYEVEYERNTVTPSELLSDRGSELAIEQLIMNAFDKANVFKTSAEDLASMKRAILDEVGKEIMAQGFGRHGISREKTQIEGYRDDDYLSVLKEFISGMAGWLSKMQYAVEVTREADRIANSDPDDKVWVHSYFKDSMKNSTYLDEVAATARSVGALYYLGFKVSSAVLNAFQNYTVGQAVLAGMMKKGGLKGEPLFIMAKAQRDMVGFAMGKNTLTDEEQDVLRQAVRQGTAHAQAVRYMSGLSEQGFGSTYKKIVEAGMTPFSWVEQYVNREPGILAAYRAFKTTPKGQFDQAAFAKAEEFTNNSHFLMGNENLPEMVRKMGALGKTLYLFQGYAHNYMLLMANALKNGEFEVIARSLGAIAALGGVFALPGADDLDKWLTKWFGVSYKLKFKMWMRRHAREYGTPGEALEAFVNHGAPSVFGVDMSRAIGVNIPFVSDPEKSFGERMGGVWGGMVKKPVMAAQALGSGQYYRAMENIMPEFFANPMRAYRQATTGATTLAGKPILDETGHQMRYSGTDVAKKVLGFQPMEVSQRTEMKSAERTLQDVWGEERKDHLAALRVARTRAELRTAIQDVITWNHRLNQSQAKGLVRPISSESIQRARRFKLGSGDKRRMAWEQEYVD